MVFENRKDAGKQLAKELYHLKLDPRKTLVFGITRGGLPVAAEIAKKYSLPLFPLVIKKIGAPYQKELALGAVASIGRPYIDKYMVKQVGADKKYLEEEVRNMRDEAREREKRLGKKLKIDDCIGKDVIIVDDGLATGATVIAASKLIKEYRAIKLYLVIPCGAVDSIESVKKYFDEIVCLEKSDNFVAVGHFYRNFSQVSDNDINALLDRDIIKKA